MSGLYLTRRKPYLGHEGKQEPRTGQVPCAICGHPVSRKKGVDIGHGLFRHKRCRAGTVRWLAHRKDDPFYRYFVMGIPGDGDAMSNGIRPMKKGTEAIAFRGPELDDYLSGRAAKDQFGRPGGVIEKTGAIAIPVDMAISIGGAL